MNIKCNGKLIDVSSPKIMGILNLTPDSFYDGGKYSSADTALRQAEKMLSDGASFIDVGGASSKPGVAEVPLEEELKRVIPIIELFHKAFPEALLSIDTYRSEVAKQAVEAGAHMVNDISAGNLDPKMMQTVGALGVPYIAMHMQGTPQNMQINPQYDDVLLDVRTFFSKKIAEAKQAGIHDIVLDPGFGFGKSMQDNYTLVRHLDSLSIDGAPVLVGLSRKSMIYKTLGITPDKALNGTTALHSIALYKGAQILRVHDVAPAMEAIKLVHAVGAVNSI